MIQNLRKKCESTESYKIQEKFNKKLENLKNKPTEINNTITDMKNILEGVNRRITDAKE